MITIFEKNTTSFKGLGLGALLPSSCIVTEELNGGFELKMEHPYDPYGKWERIQMDRILYGPTPRGLEPFRIYKVKPTMDGITVNARHIFYDLQDNLCMLVEYTGKAKGAMSHLVSRFSYAMPFSFTTNLTTSGTLYGEFINPIQALLSESDDIDSFVKVYGGELLRQGFLVSLLDFIGEDRGVTIRYGKNLLGLEVDEDISELKTRIIIRNEAGTEIVKDSPYINEYIYPKLYIVDGGDAATNEMQSMAAALFAEGIDRPKLNIRVDFQILSKTEEYKGYAVLEEVQLGDTVTVIHEKMKFSQKRKVISYEWDAVLEKYTFVELGDTLPSLSVTTNRLRQLVKSQQGKIVEIEVSIDGIRTTVSNTEKGLRSEIEQTAEAIRTEVEDTEKGLSSQIAQTAEAIRLEVQNADAGLSSKIDQTAEQIQTEVTNVKGDISLIQQRADALAVRVTNAEGDIAALEVTADHILTRVSDTESSISTLEQTAKSITANVKGLDDELGAVSSTATQTAKEMRWIVESGTSASSMTLTDDFLEIVSDNLIIEADVELFGLMTVWRDDGYDMEGGYIGYGNGDDGDNASTSGIMMMDENENNYFIATTEGARMTYKDRNAVYVINGGVHLVADGYGVVLDEDYGNLCPTEDDEQMLGSASRLWQGLYAGNATIQTSDRRKKNSIRYDMEKYENFFLLLKPTQYKMNNGDSDRYHVGFISQDIEEAMKQTGLDSKEFAGFIKSPVYEEDEEGFGVIVDYRYALRYAEFVALNTHMIQKLIKRVEELEKKLEGGDSSEN